LAATSAANFRLRRDIHQFGAVFAGNYAQSAADRDSDIQRTVSNIQGRVRYDIFFAKHWSAFSMVTARHDPFQGLELRLNVDPGIAYWALVKKAHRLWFEAGYDYQFDLRTDEARIVEDEDGIPTGEILRPVRHNHAARLFAGYANHLSEYVTFDTGFEYLQSFLVARRWRINWDLGLTTNITNRFALATTFTMRVDNDPLPNVRKVDTITALNLVVTIL
jgi:putative salt-induced outer membrane protein